MIEDAQKNVDYSIERLEHAWREAFPLFQDHWAETENGQFFAFLPQVEKLFAYNDSGQMRYYTIREDGVLVGHCAVFVQRSLLTSMLYADEVGFYLKPEIRGRGIAPRFLKTIEDNVKSIGALEMRFTTKPAAPIADKMVEKMGYTPIGKGYAKEL